MSNQKQESRVYGCKVQQCAYDSNEEARIRIEVNHEVKVTMPPQKKLSEGSDITMPTPTY